jgi:hypothetical protein
LGISRGFSHLVTHKLHGVAVSGGVEKLFDRDMDFTNVFVAEGAVAAECEDEGQLVLLGCGLADGELHGEVPGGASATVSVHFGFGFLLVLWVSGERYGDVYVHFGEEVHIFEVFGRDDIDF